MGKNSKKQENKRLKFPSREKNHVLKVEEYHKNKSSISLKYYIKNAQCFSEWSNKKLLTNLSNFIEKVNQRTNEEVKNQLGNIHKIDASTGKFKKPIELKSHKFYRLKITQQARVHGFFDKDVFYLVWLDKNHECHQ